MADKRTIGVDVLFNRKAAELTEQLPLILQRKAATKALRAAGNLVLKEARRRAPKSGEITGTRNKWSKSTRARREKFKPLKKSLKLYKDQRVKEPNIGFRVWAPVAAWIEFGNTKRSHKLWGRDSGRKLRPRPFLRPAVDSTRPLQQQTVVDTIKKILAEEAKKANG